MTRRGTTLIQHNGRNGICCADFCRFVDAGTVLILATNVFTLRHHASNSAIGPD